MASYIKIHTKELGILEIPENYSIQRYRHSNTIQAKDLYIGDWIVYQDTPVCVDAILQRPQEMEDELTPSFLNLSFDDEDNDLFN